MIKIDLYFSKDKEVVRDVVLVGVPRVGDDFYIDCRSYRVYEVCWYTDGPNPMVSLA